LHLLLLELAVLLKQLRTKVSSETLLIPLPLLAAVDLLEQLIGSSLDACAEKIIGELLIAPFGRLPGGLEKRMLLTRI
jgi:hypothetical protein